MRQWYAVYCKPREDERAETHLARQSFEVFRPKHWVRRKRAGVMTPVAESLFPRYLFVELDNVNEDWAPIRSTRGVAGLVRFGSQTVSVPSKIVQWLKANADDWGCIPQITPDYQKGDSLVIKEGPFVGYEGLFYGRRADDRVMLLLTVMEQPQKMILPESSVGRA